MAATFVQLCSQPASASDTAVARIAELAGLQISSCNDFASAVAELHSVARANCGPVVLGISSGLLTQLPAHDAKLLSEARALGNFFVYGFLQNLSHKFSEDLLSIPIQTLPVGPLTYQFHEPARRPLAGLSFTSSAVQPTIVFSNGGQWTEAQVLLSVNGHPLLTTNQHGRAADFFLSQALTRDVTAPLVPPRVAADYHADILPVALALKQMFGQYCWHNPYPAACFVIDDPLLQKCYGCFDYDTVIAELAAKRYSAAVAFIPSTWRRADSHVAAEVARHSDVLTLAVHGCDHTKSEFGDTDAKSIESKAAVAMESMGKLREATGLGFDPVMVFPQGAYSSFAPLALKHCGYLAAVNTEPCPVDFETAPVQIRDVFDLAITRYAGYPIFTRHYPRRTFDFAVDLFFGKPVLIAEHHEYFREGTAHVTEFVQQLQRFDPRLEWRTLAKTLIRSGHYQLLGPGEYAVKFTTATFELRNPSLEPGRFVCRKPESEFQRVTNVFAEGRPIPYREDAGHIRLEIELAPGEQRTISIQYAPYQTSRVERSFGYRVKAMIRRRLSEFRDNHLARNEGVLNFAKGVKRRLRM